MYSPIHPCTGWAQLQHDVQEIGIPPGRQACSVVLEDHELDSIPLNFSLLRSAIMCVRSARSTSGRACRTTALGEGQLDLVASEGRFPIAKLDTDTCNTIRFIDKHAAMYSSI